MTSDRDRVAERLVALREARGLSQEQLSALAGVSVKTISRLENGHHEGRAGTIAQVAGALGVQESHLVDRPVIEPDGLQQILERLDDIAERLRRLEAALGPLAVGPLDPTADGYVAAAELEPVRSFVREFLTALREGEVAGAARPPGSAPTADPRRAGKRKPRSR